MGVLLNYRSRAVAKELLKTAFSGKPFWLVMLNGEFGGRVPSSFLKNPGDKLAFFIILRMELLCKNGTILRKSGNTGVYSVINFIIMRIS